MTKKTFGELLRVERKQRGWSQERLAEKVGTSAKMVSRWENNQVFPGPHYQQQLEETFGKDLVAEFHQRKTLISWYMPHRNPFFIGRKDVLENIRIALDAGKTTVVLSGLGGIGKTQVAVAYARQHMEDYQYILWAVADTRETLLADLVRIATTLNLPEKQEKDLNRLEDAVKLWLHDHSGWLLILDNVDDRGLIEDYCPQSGQGHLLVTTQDSRAIIESLDIHIIEVERLGKEEGIRYLTYCVGAGKEANAKVSDTELEAASNIVEELGGLPLAIDQAAAYMHETQCGMATYLHLFQSHRKKLLESHGRLTSQHPASVVTTVSLACEKIMSTRHALDLLTICAFLHPEDIPEEFFMQGTPEHEPLFPPTDNGQLLLAEALKALLRYSLVHRHPTTTTISMHRLVQAVLRDEMEDDDQRQWAERVVQVVSSIEWPFNFIEWLSYQRYIVHAQICASWIEQWQIESELAARLLESIGHYLHERAQYAETESLYTRVLNIRSHIWDSKHPAIAESYYNLGVVYINLGKYLDAELHLHRAIALFEAAYGLLVPSLAEALNTLAQLYSFQGKYALAEKYFLLSLKSRKITLKGREDLLVASTLYCLGRVYLDQGEYTKAKRPLQQALKIREQLSGENQTLVAESLTGLASLYTSQGLHDEAKQLFLRALTIREQVLGTEHPTVADSLTGLARLYVSQGQYTEAEPLSQRALAIRQRMLNQEHPSVAESLHNLGSLYLAENRYAEAEPLLQQALAVREKFFGSTHLDVAQTCIVLTELYEKLERSTEANTFFQRAAISVDKNIEEEPTMRAIKMYIYLLIKMGRVDEAIDLEQQLDTVQEQDSGEND